MHDIHVIHDSQNLNYRKPFGAVQKGQKVKLSIDINKQIVVALEMIDLDGNRINIGMDKEYLNNGSFRYSAEIDTFDFQGILEYYFILIDKYERLYYGNNYEHSGGIGQLYEYNPVPYQITVYQKNNIPKWYKEGVVYQILVDRFYNGNKDKRVNSPKKDSFIYGRWSDEPMYITDYRGRVLRWDFYGGNIEGIIKKLDYLKSLGITVLQLSPIFKSSSCHKYDTGNYELVDEMLGSSEDLKRLCKIAESKGIKVILEAIFSYTSSDSKYFNMIGNYDGIGAYQSPNSKYYNWYKFSNYPFRYECWWGINERPNINVMRDSYIEYIMTSQNSIIKKWSEFGISGWKLNTIDELPDEFIEIMRSELKKIDSNSILIGDVWEDASNKISYSKKRKYLYGKEIQSATNYPLRQNIINFVKGYIDSYKFKEKVMSLYENYPREVFYANGNILGTNDTERILTVLDGSIRLMRLAVVIQFTFPGVPVICYGDETGLKGGKEPDNRKSYPWESQNYELIDFYKKISNIRNLEKGLKQGDFIIYETNQNILAFERNCESEKLVIIVNVSNTNKVVDNICLKGMYVDLFSGEKFKFLGNRSVVSIFGYDFKILKKISQ